MTVRCEGDSRLLEQLGEKQDFECLLTAHRLRHEDFALRVRRVLRRGPGSAWSCDYSVTVMSGNMGIRHVYLGGPGHRWVERFAKDVAGGACDRLRQGTTASAVPRRNASLRLECGAK